MEAGLDNLYATMGRAPFIVYGAGFVADFFYRLLVEKRLSDNVQAFMITGSGGSSLYGRPIISVLDNMVEKTTLVCIAVHESSLQEVEQVLSERGFTNYVCVYPYLYNIWLGEPIRQGVVVPIKKIWDRKKDKYAIAVRYLAIGQYFGENTIGYELYKKGQVLPKDSSTVEKRLGMFVDVVASLKENGYSNGNPIKILDDFTLLDGNHRLSTAIFFNQLSISCDIYDANHLGGIDMIPHEKKLLKENLSNCNFTYEEILYLEQVIDEISSKLS